MRAATPAPGAQPLGQQQQQQQQVEDGRSMHLAAFFWCRS
jgi:hypothetical protein